MGEREVRGEGGITDAVTVAVAAEGGDVGDCGGVVVVVVVVRGGRWYLG